MKKYVLIAFLLVSVVGFSQKVQVLGNWSKTLKASDISSAGSDYESSYTSKNKQSKITITPVPNSGYNRRYMPFKVFVHKEDIEWHPNLKIEAMVSSNTHGNSSGRSFQEITNNTTLFFNTLGRRKNIPIKYKITGLSVTIPAETYATEIIYTVLNL